MKSSLTFFATVSSPLATAFSIGGAWAEEHYPSHTVKMIVPYPAGGPTDIVARLIAGKLTTTLGGSFVIENVPGAAGSLGARVAALASPDGHTLLVMNQDFIVQPLIKATIPYDPFNSFLPVSLLAQAPEAIVVHPSVPAKNVAELIGLLKANPGKYSYATPGFGTTPHIAGERLFKLTHQVDITRVPFQGAAPAVNSTLGGHTQVLMVTIGAVAANFRDGQLRALAVGSPRRWPAFPDVAIMTESGLPDHEAELILGMMVPAGTPKSIVQVLSRTRVPSGERHLLAGKAGRHAKLAARSLA